MAEGIVLQLQAEALDEGVIIETLLQSRSPSCGVKQRYDGSFSGKLVDGSGVTAQLLLENGFRVIDVEDIDEYIEMT